MASNREVVQWDRLVIQSPLPIRWVISRDPTGKRPVSTSFSTDQAQTGLSILLDAHQALDD